jgi:hypothetical protein
MSDILERLIARAIDPLAWDKNGDPKIKRQAVSMRQAACVVDALAEQGYIGSTSQTPSQRLASAKARRAADRSAK